MRRYRRFSLLPISGLYLLFAIASAWGQRVPPLAKQLDPAETALVLVDFQNNFASPEGEHYRSYQKVFEETGMLENSVALVKKARALGIQVIQVTEAYSPDYRELDPSNPGGFHRSQILRQAWKQGTARVELYAPLRPGPDDRDILLPNRIAVSGFSGNSLHYILQQLGIRNVALGGFTTDGCVYATLLSAYDLGYHVYALKDAMVSHEAELAALLLRKSYPKYSRVLSSEEFLQMITAFQAGKE